MGDVLADMGRDALVAFGRDPSEQHDHILAMFGPWTEAQIVVGHRDIGVPILQGQLVTDE
ncbi:MAG: hypothetical protein KTR31_16795 [Myxococcales bacterium]|nr:hypothetical protein [Myxococcales bacterium]